MKISKTNITGCYEIYPNILTDYRGYFVKTFHKHVFEQFHLETDFVEEYYTVSHHNVLRGLHFQLPPEDHAKLVYCIAGTVIDAVVDLRIDSPNYGNFITIELSDKKSNLLYLPSGLAHGFYVTSNSATVIYKVSTVYAPSNDSGILWNSVGIPWPSMTPILSERDMNLVSFSDFKSPFKVKA